MAVQTKARSSKDVAEAKALQEKMEACRQEARRLARRHASADSFDRIDEGLGEAICGLQDLLDNELSQ